MLFHEQLTLLKERYSSYKLEIYIIGIISGAFFLNSYLREYGVSFPIEIAILPTMLFVIGLISVFLVSVAIAYSMLIGIIYSTSFKSKLDLLIFTKPSGIYITNSRSFISHSFIIYISPLLLSLILIGEHYIITSIDFIYLLIGYLFWDILYCFAVKPSHSLAFKESLNFIINNTFIVIVMQCSSLISFSIFLGVILNLKLEQNWFNYGLIMFAYLMTNVLSAYPTISVDKFNKINGAYPNLNVYQLIEKIKKTQILVVMMVIILISPMLNAYSLFGKTTLKYLNIGGGIDLTIKDKKDNCISWPDNFILSKDEKSCISKKSNLILKIGDRAYISYESDKKTSVASINIAQASVISKLPENSIYKNKDNK